LNGQGRHFDVVQVLGHRDVPAQLATEADSFDLDVGFGYGKLAGQWNYRLSRVIQR
jgi:hypothetical protein